MTPLKSNSVTINGGYSVQMQQSKLIRIFVGAVGKEINANFF